jgi:hypothetical protein
VYAVINNQSGIVTYLLSTEPTIDADGMHGEVRACDITSGTHEVVEVEIWPTDFVGNAYAFDGNVWSVVDQSALDAEAERLATIWRAEASVSMRQARLALLSAGKLADVDAAIAALPSPHKEAAQIEWEYATEVKRTSPLVRNLMPALALDDAAMDNLFKAAASL